MINDLVDGVNKFGTNWKRIKKEYNFSATSTSLQSRWYQLTHHRYPHVALENGKWKVTRPFEGNQSIYYTLLLFTIIIPVSFAVLAILYASLCVDFG